MKRSRPTGPSAFDADFAELKRRVIARTGHFYYDDKSDLLWDRVRRRLEALGLRSSAEYLAVLDDIGRSEGEWAELEREITIGETFFFRYQDQFSALREVILPDLIERKAASRQLRIWSAGCATGAEPYSVAIVLEELLGERLADWRISITGVDINEAFLETARSGRFGRWALRSLDAEQRGRWFDEDAGNVWTLKPRYRAMVRFQRFNLLDLLTANAPLELADFDLILCRNVLIYFHPETVLALVKALTDALTPEGWMLLGHAEPNPDFARFASAVSLPGTVAYRPREAAPSEHLPPAAPVEIFLPPLPEPQATPAPAKPVARPAPRPVAPVLSAYPPSDLEALFESLRTRADAGDYAGAEGVLREAMTLAPQHPVLHYYGALIAQALDRPDQAEEQLRKALYLDPDFVMARYQLGLLRLARGRKDSGRRALAAAAQLAGTLSGDVRLPEGAGLTAGEVRDMARRLL